MIVISKTYKLGVLLTILGLIFAIGATVCLNNNWIPSCYKELICDKITIFLSIFGLAICIMAWMKNPYFK